MLYSVSPRPPVVGSSSVQRGEADDEEDGSEQTDRTALLPRQPNPETRAADPQQSHSHSHSAPPSVPPLRRVYLVAITLLVLVGLLLCASLLASPILEAHQPASSTKTSSLPRAAYSPLHLQANNQQQQQQQQVQQSSQTAQPATSSVATTTTTTATVTSERLSASPLSTGGASMAQSAAVVSLSVVAPTVVSNAAGVRYFVERRYGGYIARENYNLHSNHILTLEQQPAHSGCKQTQPGAATYQCDIFNLTEALAVCTSLDECVGLVCWKEHWEGCQLKGRPLRHDNNHRFVALYKHTAAVEEAEAAWRQQAAELSAKSQRGQLGTFNAAPCALSGGSKCVVSMGLYGSDERYTGNVLINARLLPSVLPGWVLRVYHDRTVPPAILSSLRAEGAELLDMSSSRLQGGIAGMYWRFQVSEDESVDRWLIRDADCRLSHREAAAVRAWMASGYSVHIMRDHPHHGRRMMGGMWGGVKHAVRNITQRILAAASDVNNYNGDQEFLAYHVYPHVEFDQLSHDSWTCLSFTNSHPFPAAGKRPFDNSTFVGMIHGKDSDTQLNGDIRCCLVGREATIACRDNLDDKWG